MSVTNTRKPIKLPAAVVAILLLLATPAMLAAEQSKSRRYKESASRGSKAKSIQSRQQSSSRSRSRTSPPPPPPKSAPPPTRTSPPRSAPPPRVTTSPKPIPRPTPSTRPAPSTRPTPYTRPRPSTRDKYEHYQRGDNNQVSTSIQERYERYKREKLRDGGGHNDDDDHGGGHGGGHGHSGHGGYHGGHHHRPHISFGFGFGHGGYIYDPYPYGYGYGYGPEVVIYNEPTPDSGALDLNVKPKDTEVYINGRYVGETGDFDGFPTYLWLPEDAYEVIFFKEGYETVVRSFALYPDLVIDVRLDMVPGVSERPEALSRYATAYVAPPQAPAGGGDYGRDDYGDGYGNSTPPSPPGFVHFDIEPDDAAVYLDGHFLGTAEELADLEDGLLVDAGSHRLEIVHPSFETEIRDFEVETDEELEIDIDLED